MPPRAVVVHDCREVLEAVQSALEAAGFQVFITTDPLAAVDLMNRYAPQVLITRAEFGHGRPTGDVLARMLRLRRNESTTLFVSHADDEAFAPELEFRAGVHDIARGLADEARQIIAQTPLSVPPELTANASRHSEARACMGDA